MPMRKGECVVTGVARYDRQGKAFTKTGSLALRCPVSEPLRENALWVIIEGAASGFENHNAGNDVIPASPASECEPGRYPVGFSPGVWLYIKVVTPGLSRWHMG